MKFFRKSRHKCELLFQTYGELKEMYDQYLNASGKKYEENLPFANAIDAVWAIALAINNSIVPVREKLNKTLEDFTYKDGRGITDIIYEEMKKLNFYGTTVSNAMTFSH